MSDKPVRVECRRWPELDNWNVLAEVHPEPFWPGLVKENNPAIVIRQHKDTCELRVDIYDCKGGLDVTYTNGGVDHNDRDRAKWFRDIRTCRGSLRPLRVRFMASGEGGNLRLKS